MAVTIVNGAVLETVLGELLSAIVSQSRKTLRFKTILERLENTLRMIEPIFYESRRLSQVLDHSERETELFLFYTEKGKELVLKCSRIKCWNVYKKLVHANKLIRLDNELFRFFHVELQLNMMSIGMNGLIGIHALGDKMDQVLSAVTSHAGGFSDSCSVPGLPDVIVGLDSHLQELKRRLLKDDTPVLVVSAPGGCGKTTLAKMLCHDDEIRGTFGDIIYVTVSRMASLKTIIQKLLEHHDCEKHHEFQTDEEAKNQLENVMRQMGPNDALLVLDDVWSESESLVQDLKVLMPGYKVLVTSRFLFPRFDSTYELSLLNYEDAKTLLCSSAFPDDRIPIDVPDDLVCKMVKCCKGFPLALTVIGSSLCGQGVLKWRTTLKKWSEGQSIFHSNKRLLLSLQASIDALDELTIAKDCFLDLGSFPEDERIPAPALMDMWVELYDLDHEGMYTIENLLELSFRNLVNLVPTRKDGGELEGYCNEHYVTQHDLLRELAIHLSSQEPIAERKRLLIEIHGNEIPTWWTEQTEHPINARLLSITTDDAFSSVWYDLKAPKTEALILNIRSGNYTLPHFVEKMTQTKVLNVTSHGSCPAQLHNLPSIASLSNLRTIRFQHISLSPFTPPISLLKNLRKLSFVMCEMHNAFENHLTDTPQMPPNLTELEIDRCHDLTELPEELCDLLRLEKLSITNCHGLGALPEGLGGLSNLRALRLHSCTKLSALPESIGGLGNLTFVDISDCLSVGLLPDEIGDLRGLRVFKMSGCQGLRELPMSVCRLVGLEDVICDEETSYLWRDYERELRDTRINVVEDDTFGNFMKIFAQ